MPGTPGRTTHTDIVSDHLDSAENALARWVEDLRQADPADKAAWRQTARDAAGVASSLARDPDQAGTTLIGVGQTLSRQALRVVDGPADVRLPGPSFGPSPGQTAARHVQLALRAGGTASHPGWIAVLQQLRQVLDAIEAAQRARRELTVAQQLVAARQALGVAESGVQARFGGHDLDGLREAWRARETSRVSTRGADLRPTADGGRGTAAVSGGYGPEPREDRGRSR